MNPNFSSEAIQLSAVISEWAGTLTGDAQKALDRMDTTLTLAEAKVALVRRRIARRRGDGEMS